MVVVQVLDPHLPEVVDLVVVVVFLVVLEQVLSHNQMFREMKVVLVFHREVRHMDQVEVAVLAVLDKTEHHLRVVLEVLASNFQQHLEILPQQLDSLDQDQQITSLLVEVVELLMTRNQPLDKVVDQELLLMVGLVLVLVHIVQIQELQELVLKQIVDLEAVAADHHQNQVVLVDLVLS
tara:strand:+ start:703 stop:1239 length:537 start_codon:yes stop_codon:yes gene_type:complete